MDWCRGCANDIDKCVCEPDTPELRAEMLGLLTAKGYDAIKPLGPQLKLDTAEGRDHVTRYFAKHGILPEGFIFKADGTIERIPDEVH